MSRDQNQLPPSFQVEKTCIFGAGQFGTALAKLLAENNREMKITLSETVSEIVEHINKTKRHPYFHKNVQLPANVSATTDINLAIHGAQLIILAVPGQYIRGCVRSFAGQIKRDVILLNVSKALERDTNAFLHDVVDEEFRKLSKFHCYFSCLAGGMIAEEVTQGWPIAADIACSNLSVAEYLAKLFQTNTFKIGITTDVIGVELAGAFKNVLAIGAGFFDGLGLAVSSKAAYISEASREMRDLAVNLGAKSETFGLGSHAWLGDLLTTCFGDSRNRQFGELIGKGNSIQQALQILSTQKKHSEGYLTTHAFCALAIARGFSTPILRTLDDILFNEKPVKIGVGEFFSGRNSRGSAKL